MVFAAAAVERAYILVQPSRLQEFLGSLTSVTRVPGSRCHDTFGRPAPLATLNSVRSSLGVLSVRPKPFQSLR